MTQGSPQTQAPSQGQAQSSGFHNVQLIKRLVEGRIIRICYDGTYYNVWTDTGSKRWYMWYSFTVRGSNVHMVDALRVGCLDEDLLVEPADNPSTLSPDFINDAHLIRKVVEGKIIRICHDGGLRYSVWADTGSKRWFMFYRIEVRNNEAKILEELHDGCSEGDILIEPVGD